MTREASSIASSGSSCRHRSSASTSNELLCEQSQMSSIDVGLIAVGANVLGMSDMDWESDLKGGIPRVGLLEVGRSSIRMYTVSCIRKSYSSFMARVNS